MIIPSFAAKLPGMTAALGRAAIRLEQQLAGLPFVASSFDVRAVADW